MDEMYSYIFGKLKTTEDIMHRIGHAMVCQNKINRKLALAGMLTGVGFILIGVYMQEQDKKIKQLSDEINKMKEPIVDTAAGDTESEE